MSSVFRKPSILIVGAYPPPVGGNSIHIERLRALLIRDNYSVSVIDLYGSKLDPVSDENVIRTGPPGLTCLLRTALTMRKLNYDLIHFHVSGMLRFLLAGTFLLSFASNRARKVITIHSGSFSAIASGLGSIRRLLLRRLLGKFDAIITVSKEQKEAIESLSGRTSLVIPAFLPSLKEVDDAWKAEVRTIRASYTKVLVSSGYGIPLYGYEQILKAFSDALLFEGNIAVVLCIYNTYDEAYLERLKAEAGSGITLIFYRERSPEQFNHLLENADVYIRATRSDGDAVAIREANAAGLPVVASTAVKRPEFCLLYTLDDIGDLRRQLEYALRHDANGATPASNQSYYHEILSSYSL